METVFLRLTGALFLALLAGNAPLDVAPPVAATGLAAGAIAVLCVLVIAIVVVAFFVIRAVKKIRAARNNPDTSHS